MHRDLVVTPVQNPALSAVANVPVLCYRTTADFIAALPSGSAVGTPGWWDGRTITLRPSVCNNLGKTVTYSAVFVFSHEIAHAQHLDTEFAADHQSDPAFLAESAAITSRYGIQKPFSDNEAAADCIGVNRASAVAYALGMRGRKLFAGLALAMRSMGYVKIPPGCFR